MASMIRDAIARIYKSVTTTGTPPKDGQARYRRGEEAAADTTRLWGASGVPIETWNPDEIIGRWGYRKIDEMLRDDQVKAATMFKQNAVIATGWTIKSPEGQSDDWEPTAFCKEVLESIKGSFDSVLSEILSAIPYGHSLTETIWAERDGHLVIESLKTRHPHGITFVQDVHGNVTGIKQNGKDLTEEKYIRWAYDGRFANPYGRTDLSAAYRGWWGKTNAYKWLAMLLERMGIPPIYAMYDPEVFTREKAGDVQTLLAKMRSASTAAIPRPSPESLDFWSTEIKGEVSGVFVPALSMYNTDIARGILMPGLLGATPETNIGSFARAQVHFDVFLLVVERIRRELSNLVVQDQIIVPLCEVNFGVLDAYPQFDFNPLTDEVRTELLTTWGQLVSASAVTNTIDDEKHIRSQLKFPPLSAEAEAQRNRDNEARRRAAEAPRTDGNGGNPAPGEQQPADKLEAMQIFGFSEARIDYAQIERDLDTAETQTVEAVKAALVVSRDALVALLRRDFDPVKTRPAWVQQLELRKWRGVQDALSESMRAAVESGRRVVRRETGRMYYDSPMTITPHAALRAMADKAFWVSGIMKQTLIEECQAILFQAIRNGEPIADTMAKIRDAWLPYLGDDHIIVDEEQIHPHRLETIVRTNMTDAYNTGRLTEMRDPELDPFVQAIRYSAILDTRTTPLCEGLHGAVFKRNDAALDKLTPPNHFNCRSLLVPVMITEEIRAEEWATAERIGRALDLMKPSFGGVERFAFDEDKHPRVPAGDPHGGEFSSSGSMTQAAHATEEQRARLDALRVPPAWRDVKISADPHASLQVTGIDSKGRTQYVYSAEHSERMAALKFERLKAFSAEAPGITSKALADMRSGDHNAAALYLIAKTGIRVGSDADTGGAVKAYGATTLLGKHAKVQGDEVTLNFVGKKGVQIEKTLRDPDFARFLRGRNASADERLFATNDAKVRDYLKRAGGRDEFKVKDFRTWHGTTKALELISTGLKTGAPSNQRERQKLISQVKAGVARHLGNTPAVAFASYIDPAVWGRIQ